MCDFYLPPWCKWKLRSSGTLRNVDWWFDTDVSEQSIWSHFQGSSSPTLKCDRQVVPKRRYRTTNPQRVKSQNSEYFMKMFSVIFALFRAYRRKGRVNFRGYAAMQMCLNWRGDVRITSVGGGSLTHGHCDYLFIKQTYSSSRAIYCYAQPLTLVFGSSRYDLWCHWQANQIADNTARSRTGF